MSKGKEQYHRYYRMKGRVEQWTAQRDQAISKN